MKPLIFGWAMGEFDVVHIVSPADPFRLPETMDEGDETTYWDHYSNNWGCVFHRKVMGLSSKS